MQQNLDNFNLGQRYVNEGVGIDKTYMVQNRLIGYYFDHTHCDFMEKPEGLSYWNVSTASSKPDYYENPPQDNKSWERPMGNLEEDCWVVVMVYKVRRKVKLKRYGAGQDREYCY